MISAFKKSGVENNYDVVDELDVITYVESLPAIHEPIEDLWEFKHYSAQYFTPSELKSGLARQATNIKNIQGITFDLDMVDDWHELMMKFYELIIKFHLECYLWKSPSAYVQTEGHKNGSRIFVPLAEPIHPKLLSQAVDELVIAFAKSGFNLLDYGADLKASKTVGRLMGLPIQQRDTIVPWNLDECKRYRVRAKYQPSQFKSTFDHEGFMGLNEPTVENLTSFISGYVDKHHLGFNKGERDNNLTKIYGGLAKAFSEINPDDLLSAFFEAGIAQTLDRPEKDINNKSKRLLS